MPSLITLNFDHLDCTCWQMPSPEDYCPHCDDVCLATYEDFECNVRDWAFFGSFAEYFRMADEEVSATPLLTLEQYHRLMEAEEEEEEEHLANVAMFFEEARAPTPDPGPHRYRSPLETYMGDYPEGEAPWRRPRSPPRPPKKLKKKASKPYNRPVTRSKKVRSVVDMLRDL